LSPAHVLAETYLDLSPLLIIIVIFIILAFYRFLGALLKSIALHNQSLQVFYNTLANFQNTFYAKVTISIKVNWTNNYTSE